MPAKANAATYNITQPTSMAEPAPTVYGVMGPAYAASLQQNTGTNILSQMALRGEASKERQAYQDQLVQAQRAYLTGLNSTNRSKLDETVLNSAAERSAQGIGGAYSIGADGTLQANQPQLLTADASHLNDESLKSRGSYLTGLKAGSEAGYEMSPEQVAAAMMTPGEDNLNLPDGSPRVKLSQPGVTLKDVSLKDAAAKAKAADAAMVSAQAAKTRAVNGISDSQVIITDNGFGLPPTVQQKLKGNRARGYLDQPPPPTVTPPGPATQPPANNSQPYGSPGTRIPLKTGGYAQVIDAHQIKMPDGTIKRY